MKRDLKRTIATCSLLTLSLGVLASGCTKKNPLSMANEKKDDAPAQPAQVDSTSRMTEECQTLRTRLLGLAPENTKGLEELLAEYVGVPGNPKDIASYKEADTRFYVAQLHVLRALRSSVWRASGIFEGKNLIRQTVTAKDERISHNGAYSALRSMAAGLNAFLPESPAQVAFRYLVEPSEEAVKAGKYNTVAEMQTDLHEKLMLVNQVDGKPRPIGALQVLLKTLTDLEGVVTDENPIVWDSRLAFGGKAYEGNDAQRFERIGDLELKAVQASAHIAMHDVYVFNAYDYDAGPRYFDSVSRKFGIDGLLGDNVEGLPASKLLKELSPNPSKEYKELFTLRESKGGAYMAAAFDQHLTKAVLLARQVHDGVKVRSGAAGTPGERAVLVREWIGENVLGKSEPGLKIIEKLMAGRATLTSPITGDFATFDLPAFYKNPPKDLKELLPKKFDEGADFLVGADGKTKYRNYWKGRPTGWGPAVDPFVSGASSPGGMERAGRVIAHMGGIGLNNPLIAFVELSSQGGAQ